MQNMSGVSASGDARSSTAALGLQAAVMPSSKSPPGLHYGTGISSSISAVSTLLRAPEEDIIADSKQTGTADIE